jgi:phenylalanyl-tRNA synthetase alpha chain
MSDVPAELEKLAEEARGALRRACDADAVEQFRIRFLGSNGKLKEAMKLLGSAPKEARPALGQQLNALKQELTQAWESRRDEVARAPGASGIDVTEPGRLPEVGNAHLLTKVIDELTDLFARMGFSVASGPEVEDEFHNFVALNIPENHPAREPSDNYYLEPGPGGASGGLRLLRTQTSTVQIRVMRSQKPPIRVVIPGKVYRPDTHDDTHLSQFHQLEALVVDRNISMIDLKSTIQQFINAYIGPGTRSRFRASFFPFTEPSAEVDVWFEDRQKWIELGGCGMVHPNVLRTCGIDPEVYSGWAFGFGIERIAMRKYGVSNIRQFVENDIRFLEQF